MGSSSRAVSTSDPSAKSCLVADSGGVHLGHDGWIARVTLFDAGWMEEDRERAHQVYVAFDHKKVKGAAIALDMPRSASRRVSASGATSC